MPGIIEKRYRLEPGPHGSNIIVQSGRCSGDRDTQDVILAGLVRRYSLEVLSQTQGVVLKVLDGSNPSATLVEPPTMNGRKFRCVKVGAVFNPFTPKQSGGKFDNDTVLTYEIRWQEVGALA